MNPFTAAPFHRLTDSINTDTAVVVSAEDEYRLRTPGDMHRAALKGVPRGCEGHRSARFPAVRQTLRFSL